MIDKIKAKSRPSIYFAIGALTVWMSHASSIEDGFTAIQIVNVVIASILGGFVALRAKMDNLK